ncbi:MAG: LysR family transcriptional regulator [Deltaproteobacteria bacterium]|nr:LysR family transcriptional regulator [Deltaproteobacteria bacterium]
MNSIKQKMAVAGTVSLCKEDREFLGDDRIRLLEMIEEHGSITKAAKAVGISYKTAWDTMDAINNLSDKPLFIRMAGGKSGGGTRLTEEGREVIHKYRVIREEQEKFLANITKRIGSAHELYKFIKRITMKVSARNIFAGTVTGLTRGAINSEVLLSLKGGDTLVSVVTNESVEGLGLREGSEVYAIIKASSVLIGKDLEESKLSTGNILAGRIINLLEGAVNTEVTLELAGGNTISAVITNFSAQKLALREGDRVCAVCKASDIILGVS